MSLLKRESNHVGRPSNEELKQKRNKKIIIGVVAVVVLGIISGGVYLLVSGTNLFGLMGNSVTKTVRVCPNGYYYNKKNKACFVKNSNDGTNARPVKTLNISSNSYRIQAMYLGVEKNVSSYDLFVLPNYKSDKLYSDSFSAELYEVNNGKYKKIETMGLISGRYVEINFNSTKTYVARLIIKDAVTGKKVYAPYSKKVTLTPNKISVKPQITLSKSKFGKPYVGYKNGKYRVDISLSNLDTIRSSLNFGMGDNLEGPSLIKLEIYEVVNGKNKYIAEYPMNVVYSTQIKKGEKKQYKVRLRFDEYGKKIYSGFSKVLTVDTNTFSS